MSVFNYILAMWITLAIGIGLIGAAPWLSSRAKGPRHFRSVRTVVFALKTGSLSFPKVTVTIYGLSTERAIKSEHRAE